MIQQPSFSMIHKVSGAASQRFYNKEANKTLALPNFIFVFIYLREREKQHERGEGQRKKQGA